MNTDRRPALRIWLFAALLFIQLTLSACKPVELPLDHMEQNETTEISPPLRVSPPAATETALVHSARNNLIPKPVAVKPADGIFTLQAGARILVAAGDPELEAVGRYLAEQLSPATGYPMQVMIAVGAPEPGNIYLALDARDDALGEEGYLLTITTAGITISANCPAGAFYGVQTLLQLLPPAAAAKEIQPGPWIIPAAVIRDYPRFEWRGVMLDVARHFFSVEDVKRYIDLASRYKLNRFHLHLSDDQGWRIMIESWPELALTGGQSAVGGDPGGYYTQADYAEITAYARSRYMVIVPEIDMPGHTNAALNAYPEFNCDGTAPPVHTGIEVGFSSLCIQKEITFEFVEDVIRELAEITPGKYIHIGGDETQATTDADYQYFMRRIQNIVASHGKQMVGWEEIAKIELLPSSIPQIWNYTLADQAVRQDVHLILSPATRTYLDMKYDPSSPLGLQWAALIEVQDAYEWDPVSDRIPESSILGIEAPLWSETLRTIQDIEYMAFPRLPGLAEIGWSPRGGRDWAEYRQRLAAHGPRLAAINVNFYRSPQIHWETR